MFKFLKEYWSVISKMMINQFGMIIFALMLSLATSQNDLLFFLCSICSIIFYWFLLYTVAWDFGAKDKIRLDGGRIRYSPFKGVFLSLWANVVNILLDFGTVFAYLFITDLDNCKPVWAYETYAVCNAIGRMIQPMYLGVIQRIMPTEPYLMLTLWIPAPIICGIAYYMSIHGRSIAGSLGLQKGTRTVNGRSMRY